jgi:hypothetical protein
MLLIEFRKGNKSDLLLCKRNDGSSTWMETKRFSTIRDLIHYAVEKHLNFKRGFFGLVESGLNLVACEERLELPTSKLPAEASYAENLVNLFVKELEEPASIKEFEKSWLAACERLRVPNYPIDEMQIESIREEIRQLIQHWNKLPEKKSLELVF